MKNATFRQLKIFETVARHLSFSRAAEELHLTQPAVSTQVSKLEDHAGVPLFEQLGKKIYLTAAGEEMLQFCKAVMLQIQNVEEAMAQCKGVSGGTLNVGVISAGDYFFPRLLVQFANENPGISFNLTVHNREELLHQLADILTEMAVLLRPPVKIDSLNEAFTPHPKVIVASPDHPLAGHKQITPSALATERIIAREKGTDTQLSMQEAFSVRIDNPNIAI